MVVSTEILRARYVCFGWALVLSLLLGPGLETVAAQESPQVVRVEEDWELVAGTPDPNSDAPQVSCVISPVSNVASLHAAFEINHQSLPDFVAGGLQLQAWNGEEPLTSRKFPNGSVLSQAGETVRWTQAMEVVEGGVSFQITDGSSSTWGSFGGQGYLRTDIVSALTDLNGYTPTVSIANSGVGYAANRVQSLVLKNVRLITSTGEVLETNPNWSVYPKQ